jgi:uncharacterized protein YdiU (UPF0061 family)
MAAQTALVNSLDTLRFDNRYVNDLPGDNETRNFTRQVFNACYSKVSPTHVANPKLITYSNDVAGLLELSPSVCESEEFLQVFSGNALVNGMEPFAMCYGGHQFGVWAGQLGDGRVINLGEIVNSKGERWALQLKGAGLTPYSRNADGLAVLRSSIREFLISEAMFHLGVPTTRALSLITTGEQVIRDMFYNGDPRLEPGAIVCRVAPSFIRFGHFQILAARGEIDLLRQLTHHTISTYFPQLGKPDLPVYIAWFKEVCRLTAEMIAHWHRVGFVHGVMNTDNMSILGLTIDYGPYGWMDNYDPNWTPNTTDAAEGRYRFANQPACAYWNLAQLANAIYPLIQQAEPLQEGLAMFAEVFQQRWHTLLAQKLGLPNYDTVRDDNLQTELLEILKLLDTDMTIFFRRLAEIDLCHDDCLHNPEVLSPLREAFYDEKLISQDYRLRLMKWLADYRGRILQSGISQANRINLMNKVNPKFVLRNYLAQQAIDKAEIGDYAMLHELMAILKCPYDNQSDKEDYAKKRPEWAKNKPGCSALSCSS